MYVTRIPTQADLPAILELTRANRSLLAKLEPDFWRKSANADALHEMFVRFQIGNDQLVKRILERAGGVIGYAVSVRHPSGFYFVDDICLDADADWRTDGVQLLNSIEERPAIMTAPHGDTARVHAARTAGLAHVATVRSLRFDQEPPLALGAAPVAVVVPENLPAPPRHPFLPEMAEASMTAIGDGHSGYALVSPAIAAPPIYDPGGKPSVVDRVIGNDRQSLLANALSFAAQRGDLGIILIVAADDVELSAIADGFGARHPVDIFEWSD